MNNQISDGGRAIIALLGVGFFTGGILLINNGNAYMQFPSGSPTHGQGVTTAILGGVGMLFGLLFLVQAKRLPPKLPQQPLYGQQNYSAPPQQPLYGQQNYNAPPQQPISTVGGDALERKLSEIVDLHKRGVLTDEEYQAKRRKLLDL